MTVLLLFHVNILFGNFRIFLPLRFYVKSILVILKPQELPFWPFKSSSDLWNFWEFVIFPSVKWPKTHNSNPPHWVKQQFLANSNGKKMPFLAILEVLNFDYYKFKQIFNSQIYQYSNFRFSEIVKNGNFWDSNLAKIDFT